MSCNGCAKPFSFLKKEIGCPGCGFGYCSKCLEHPIIVKKTGKLSKVCTKCKMADESGNKAGPSEIEPPKAYLRRLESLDNPSKPPIVVYQHNDRLGNLKKGLSPEDYEIAERLEKLRAERKSTDYIPSNDEIKERLAKLRDEPIQTSQKSNLPAVDLRSDQQKCDDLLSQYMDECAIEQSKLDFDQQLHQRLNNLKGSPSSSGGYKDNTNPDLLVQQIMNEPMDEIASDLDDTTSESEKLSETEEDSDDSTNESYSRKKKK